MSKDKKPKNPVSDEKGSNRGTRGGSARSSSFKMRSARRYFNGPSIRPDIHLGGMRFGFRIVKNIPKKEKRDE